MAQHLVDVVVVGGTAGGCAAAIMAGRMGRSVCLLEPTPTLGGMNANGQCSFDTVTLQAVSGVGEDFGRRIEKHYNAYSGNEKLLQSKDEMHWENHVCARTWREMMAELPSVEVLLGAVAVETIVENGQVVGVKWEPAVDPFGNIGEASESEAQEIRGKVVIDATYEADVAAWASASFRLGREARSADEPHAGKIFTSYMDRQIADDYAPNTILPGSSGEGDDQIMAFNSRLCLRVYEGRAANAPHRMHLPPPGYDARNYSFDRSSLLPGGQPVFGTGLIPGQRGTIFLNRMFDGNDLVGPNREYVLAHSRDRRQLRQQFVDHALGYLYFIQTEGGFPELGLADDQFTDNNNIPYQIYVREGRRIIGRQTMTEADINPYIHGTGPRPPHKPDAVASGDYMVDIKKCRDSRESGHAYPDGVFFGRGVRAPFQIPYGCLLPREVAGLLVVCGLSATHYAFGAIRLEAVWIQTGMAAGIAAALAVKMDCEPAVVPVERIQEILIAHGGKPTYFADVGRDNPHFAAVHWAALRGYIPTDWEWRFLPQQPIDWAEFAIATVTCLRIPISVTAEHFEGVDRWHRAFRHIEALYDLGSRAGVNTYPGMRNPALDPLYEFYRTEPSRRFLALDASKAMTQREVLDRLGEVSRALGHVFDVGAAMGLEHTCAGQNVSRAELCSWLKAIAARIGC